VGGAEVIDATGWRRSCGVAGIGDHAKTNPVTSQTGLAVCRVSGGRRAGCGKWGVISSVFGGREEEHGGGVW
jgi:hypothetical protein